MLGSGIRPFSVSSGQNCVTVFSETAYYWANFRCKIFTVLGIPIQILLYSVKFLFVVPTIPIQNSEGRQMLSIHSLQSHVQFL